MGFVSQGGRAAGLPRTREFAKARLLPLLVHSQIGVLSKVAKRSVMRRQHRSQRSSKLCEGLLMLERYPKRGQRMGCWKE
jgi:hypothetical protein